ncbi:MAG: ion transporter, partial [Spirochaetia bacterium]|nr:ion transporter [Spirochaetia bacterium]
FVLLLTVFTSIEIPMRLVLDYKVTGFLLGADVFVSVCFFADVVLNFFTAEYTEGGLAIIEDRRKITRDYLKGWFIVDFMAAIPFDLFMAGSMAMFTDAARVMRLLRLLRLARLAQFLQKIAKSQVINISLLRMVFLVFWVLMIAHFNACAWIALGGGNIASLEKGMGNITAEDMALIPGGRLYLRALYWSITTIATIGYGDITPQTSAQTAYAILIELMGAGMYGYAIGNIASLLANIDVARAQFTDRLEKIGTFMRFRKIPDPLQDKVRNYYSYLWETRRGYDESRVLEDLPSTLKLDVALFLNQEILAKVPLFQGASDDLIRRMVMNREIALLMSSPRTASIRAVDYCDLYALEKDTFQHILRDFPDFSVQVREFARKRQEEIGGRAFDEEDTGVDEVTIPPLRAEGLKAERGADGVISLYWQAVEGAAVYQLIRFNPVENRWKILHGFIQSNRFRDKDADPNVTNSYRVRACNEAGSGEWSQAITV